ncbi:MAG: nuclear transport factor 2 family protein [Verrucomicrobiota bacterium]|nr:nuclear transport factor 2 family protein [Verrucomicrobiota bacterium]
MKNKLTTYAITLLASGCFILTPGVSRADEKAPDAAAITAAAEDFHKALAEGKPDQVMAMLQPDALIVEGGTVQTRDEYQSEHLGADIAYAAAVPGKQLSAVVQQDGDVAWVTSTFQVTGEFHDKPVDSLAAETMVLTKTPEGWRIRSIHWSSHKAPKK